MSSCKVIAAARFWKKVPSPPALIKNLMRPRKATHAMQATKKADLGAGLQSRYLDMRGECEIYQ
jgi:hypothetical protein